MFQKRKLPVVPIIFGLFALIGVVLITLHFLNSQGSDSTDSSGSVAPPGALMAMRSTRVCHYTKASSLPNTDSDAWFTTDNGRAVGIADGETTMARHIVRALRQAYMSESVDHPAEVIAASLSKDKDTRPVAGKSSVSAVYLAPNGDVSVYTVGDAKVLWLRNGKIYYESEEQIEKYGAHGNTAKMLSQGNHRGLGNVKLGKALRGDIFVLASDGIWDNVAIKEIRRILTSKTRTSAPCAIVDEALRISIKITGGKTPLADKAEKNGNFFKGGRLDDMTVVVAKVDVDDGVTTPTVVLRHANTQG
eukprot:PhF_6_TR29230/c0_g1_i1/m.42779/K17508/PTC7, PPTC7; protein phosphatase PTC7